MQIFCEDHALNISARYLQPGFGFGGSCLPKDLRAVVSAAKAMDVQTPLLGNVLASNDAHIQRVVDTILESGRRRVALLGLSFKPGTDDLRESPFVKLAEHLIGKGIVLRVYDPDVTLANVFGRNRAYIDQHLPHMADVLSESIGDAVSTAEVVVIGKRLPELEALERLRRDALIIDLVGLDQFPAAIRPWFSNAPGGAPIRATA
jgi:GDP-mannose 6-dehydrogenase